MSDWPPARRGCRAIRCECLAGRDDRQGIPDRARRQALATQGRADPGRPGRRVRSIAMRRLRSKARWRGIRIATKLRDAVQPVHHIDPEMRRARWERALSAVGRFDFGDRGCRVGPRRDRRRQSLVTCGRSQPVPLATMPAEFIYTSYKLARHYPPDRTVLEDISISFYPGAKIGVIGPNGAGQVEPAADHGRPRRRVHRRGAPHARLHGRLPEPGAAARPGQGRQGQRDGRRRRGPGPHRPVQRRDGQVVRSGRRLRGDRRRAERARGPHQRRGCVEPGAQRGHRHGRAPLPARRRRRDDPVGWREATRGAVPAAAPAPGPAAARRADQPPRRRVAWSGWSGSSASTRAPSSPSPTTATSWTTSPSGSWSSTAAAGIPFSGNYSSWLEQKLERMSQENEGVDATPADPRPRARLGAHVARRPASRRARPGSSAYEQLLAEAQDEKVERRELEIAIPPGPRLGDRSSRSRTCARATATGCSSRT